MNILYGMNQAIDYMERNLAGEIDLEQAASYTGYSSTYFQRIFACIAQLTVMEYGRKRRLTLAGAELKNRDIQILDLAIKYGYTSADAFTKAFKGFHGVTPSMAREDHVKLNSFSPIRFHISVEGSSEMKYRMEQRKAMRVIGIQRHFVAPGNDEHDVDVFWNEVMSNGMYERLLALCDQEPYGVHGFMQVVDETHVDYMIGVVSKKDTIEGTTEAMVPASLWAIFEQTGAIQDTMVDMTWKEIEEKANQGSLVLLPLGVIEEHGPHLPLGSDIYASLYICHRVREKAEHLGKSCVIAPPYYWGINHCTGAFPGSFSVRPETMKMMLHDLLLNLKQFGFRRVIAINQHGDPVHNQTILEAMKEAREELGMDVKFFIELFDLPTYQLTGQEEYCLVDEADYSEVPFLDEDGKLDIHAGAYETAFMANNYSDTVKYELIQDLPDHSLSYETLNIWMQGGEGVKDVVPFGYAGNPAGYEVHLEMEKKLFDILCNHLAEVI